MIKRKLCKSCLLWTSCSSYCQESADEEKRENSKNYMEKGSYKALNTIKSTYPDARMSGGFGKFN